MDGRGRDLGSSSMLGLSLGGDSRDAEIWGEKGRLELQLEIFVEIENPRATKSTRGNMLMMASPGNQAELLKMPQQIAKAFSDQKDSMKQASHPSLQPCLSCSAMTLSKNRLSTSHGPAQGTPPFEPPDTEPPDRASSPVQQSYCTFTTAGHSHASSLLHSIDPRRTAAFPCSWTKIYTDAAWTSNCTYLAGVYSSADAYGTFFAMFAMNLNFPSPGKKLVSWPSP
ncbi:hypothetical protein CRG98_042476 [Punica granatum]|uniref:Uncharacterized protein n=1 Tax=Punica granatum TaxID=22663 RepID=A0A2I0HZK7_PUNGR|nr:hypothetical protein CRG98_042476 [Punica granatum]